MTRLYFHDGEVAVAVTEEYVGSPMYGLISEHRLAFVLVLAFAAAVLVFGRKITADDYRRLDHTMRLALWLTASSAVIHFGLALGHEPGWFTALYLAGAAALGFATINMFKQGRRWRLMAGLSLAASLLVYAIAMVAGEPPDQLGLATKLVELTALAILMTPRIKRTRRRLVMANAATVSLFLVMGVAGWVGAFSGGDGHHLGDVPTPGVLLPSGEDRPPTASEQAAHDALVEAVREQAAIYADPAAAASAGYDVDNIFGSDYHAANESYKVDDHHFDPTRPENLIYGIGASGNPVLLGVMFEMEGLRAAGPAIGGPLTVWHAHDHVCFTVTGLGPLVSPWGGCPIGHIAVPITNEMIHIWTVPGVEEPVGELEDWQRDEYLAAH